MRENNFILNNEEVFDEYQIANSSMNILYMLDLN